MFLAFILKGMWTPNNGSLVQNYFWNNLVVLLWKRKITPLFPARSQDTCWQLFNADLWSLRTGCYSVLFNHDGNQMCLQLFLTVSLKDKVKSRERMRKWYTFEYVKTTHVINEHSNATWAWVTRVTWLSQRAYIHARAAVHMSQLSRAQQKKT